MTIIDKLNLTKYRNLAVLNQPGDYDLFDGYNTKISEDHDGIFMFGLSIW